MSRLTRWVGMLLAAFTGLLFTAPTALARPLPPQPAGGGSGGSAGAALPPTPTVEHITTGTSAGTVVLYVVAAALIAAALSALAVHVFERRHSAHLARA